MTDNEKKAPSSNDELLKGFNEHREEILEWEKYVSQLKFHSIDDMAAFCKEYYEAARAKPDDNLLNYKWASIARHYMPVFLATYYKQSFVINMFTSMLMGDAEQDVYQDDGNVSQEAPKTSGVPKIDKSKLN